MDTSSQRPRESPVPIYNSTSPHRDWVKPSEPLLHVHIVYRGYELVEQSTEQLFWRARDPSLQIVDAEVDVLNDGRFEHRLSTWPERVSIVIRFEAVDVVVVRFANGKAEILKPLPPT